MIQITRGFLELLLITVRVKMESLTELHNGCLSLFKIFQSISSLIRNHHTVDADALIYWNENPPSSLASLAWIELICPGDLLQFVLFFLAPAKELDVWLASDFKHMKVYWKVSLIRKLIQFSLFIILNMFAAELNYMKLHCTWHIALLCVLESEGLRSTCIPLSPFCVSVWACDIVTIVTLSDLCALLLLLYSAD